MTTWQSIDTAAKNDDRILVMEGTWVRGNRQTLVQSFPCLVVWDEGEWMICDNEGPRSTIRDPKLWAPLPPDLSENALSEHFPASPADSRR